MTRMGYRLLANGVLIVHVGFIAFVVGGLLLTIAGGFRRWRWVHNLWFRLAHLAAIMLVVIEAWSRIECPLTTLESRLRMLGGQNPYAPGGFIASWLRRLIFFNAQPWVFTLAYTLFALLVLAALIFVPIRRRSRRGSERCDGPGPARATPRHRPFSPSRH